MSQTLTLALLALQVVTALAIGAISYKARQALQQIDRNTRLRRWIAGDQHFDSEGRLDQITDMHDDFERDMTDVKESLEHLKEQCDAIVDALEDQTDQEIEDPDSEFRITDD